MAVIGLTVMWEGSGLGILTVYVVSVIAIGIVIGIIENNLGRQLVTRKVRAHTINRLGHPQGLLTPYQYLTTYHIICPFCKHMNMFDQTNMTNIPIFNRNESICIHFRELFTAVGDIKYGRFVNIRESGT